MYACIFTYYLPYLLTYSLTYLLTNLHTSSLHHPKFKGLLYAVNKTLYIPSLQNLQNKDTGEDPWHEDDVVFFEIFYCYAMHKMKADQSCNSLSAPAMHHIVSSFISLNKTNPVPIKKVEVRALKQRLQAMEGQLYQRYKEQFVFPNLTHVLRLIEDAPAPVTLDNTEFNRMTVWRNIFRNTKKENPCVTWHEYI